MRTLPAELVARDERSGARTGETPGQLPHRRREDTETPGPDGDCGTPYVRI
jgi:hypothetical protein